MKLSQLIAPDRISIGWPNALPKEKRNKWSLIQHSVEELSEHLKFSENEKTIAQKQVFEREKSMTTGIGEGVALPHASLDFVKSMSAMLKVFPSGIDFDSIDKKPAYIFILILVPKNQFQKHIRTLASIARLMNDTPFRLQLTKCKSTHEIYDIIIEKENE